MMRSASSNSDTFDKWLMSPVWIMKAGFFGSALTLPMASSSVPSALGLAGLSKPMWLSLICRNVRPLASCARASPMMPSACGTPPAMVHSTPVPTQVMHSRTLRRLTPSSRSKSLIALSHEADRPKAEAAIGASKDQTDRQRGLFPMRRTIWDSLWREQRTSKERGEPKPAPPPIGSVLLEHLIVVARAATAGESRLVGTGIRRGARNSGEGMQPVPTRGSFGSAGLWNGEFVILSGARHITEPRHIAAAGFRIERLSRRRRCDIRGRNRGDQGHS